MNSGSGHMFKYNQNMMTVYVQNTLTFFVSEIMKPKGHCASNRILHIINVGTNMGGGHWK